MIKHTVSRILSALTTRTERHMDFIDFDSKLDLMKNLSRKDIISQAVYATAMLRRAAAWCGHLGANKTMVVDFVQRILDDADGCDVSQAEQIWQDLDARLADKAERKGTG